MRDWVPLAMPVLCWDLRRGKALAQPVALQWLVLMKHYVISFPAELASVEMGFCTTLSCAMVFCVSCV
jgi:hypothetical protein